MLRNYLRTALRQLTNSKLFSAINITGLAVGLTACILIALYVQDETSYDEHWTKADRIYRINTRMDSTGAGLPPCTTPGRCQSGVEVTSMALEPALEQFFADEIEHSARVMPNQYEVVVDGERFVEAVSEVDSDIARIFDFEVLAGDLEDALEDPRSVALRHDVAERLFGARPPVGETMTFLDQYGTTTDYRVGAVYRLPPANTVLDLPAMVRIDMTKYRWANNWRILSAATYVELAPDAAIEDIRARAAQFVDRYVDISGMMAGPDVKPSDRVELDFQQIADAYLHSPGRGGGNPTVVYAFSAVAILVLLIACINFTILTTAKATQREKEVATRKALGASRGQLIAQFLGESFLFASIATLLSLALVELVLPYFAALVGRDLELPYDAPLAYPLLIGLVALVGFASGLYPAFVLSHFRPAGALAANRSTETKGSMTVRGALVIFQFGVSIALMIATIAVYTQVRYVVQRDPGFGRENVLLVEGLLRVDNPLSSVSSNARKETLRREIENLPGVTSVGMSGHQPGQTTGLSTIVMGFTLLGGAGDAQQIAVLGTDSGFFETYGIEVIAGRDWSDERDRPSRIFPGATDDDGGASVDAPAPEGAASVVINAAAARQLGFTDASDAIGRQLRTSASGYTGVAETLTIIGVVADTQFFSLRSPPRAEAYVLAPAFADVLAVRFDGSPQAVLDRVARVWARWAGDEPLETSFLEQNLIEEFAAERMEGRLLTSFALLAVVVACLGLFGSAAFTVERRTKEIGVRKVLGAEVPQIVGLFLWQFSRPVMIANLLAWPLALLVLSRWLERFPYRIETWTLVPICLAAGLAALAVAWLTVAGSTLRAATTSPVRSLRYE
ncbi:MAG TPA: ABC transporter permease [Gammaproteobacteria bacterium]